MKKILKCVLAFALLSMVFTSTVLAEGSITAGNMKPTSEGVELNAKPVTIGETSNAAVNTAIAKVQDAAGTSGAKVSDLSEDTKSNLGLTDFDSNAVITPFVDITPTSTTTGSVKVKVTLNSAILEGAKKITAIHVKDNGDVDKIPASKSGNDSVEFTTDSFSPFAFVIEYEPEWVYVPSKPAGSGKDPVVNTAAGEVNHTNYMAYAAFASAVAVGAIVLASKKLGNNVK